MRALDVLPWLALVGCLLFAAIAAWQGTEIAHQRRRAEMARDDADSCRRAARAFRREARRLRRRARVEIDRADRLQRELHEAHAAIGAMQVMRPEPAPDQSPRVAPAKEEPPVLRELAEASRGLHPDVAARIQALGSDWAREDAMEAVEELLERNGGDWTRTNAQLATGAGGVTL